jgi:hypothetical protein
MKRFVTRALIVVAAILGIVFAQVAPASATTSKDLESNLAALWTTVLETPADENPFTNPDASTCFDLGHSTVAPFAGGVEFSCTVKPDTKLFVVGFSWECSSFTGDHFDYKTNKGQLRQCARDHDLQAAPTVTVDGQSVTLTKVETRALNIVLPEDKDNIFGEPKGTPGLSVAHGWVTLLDPLTPGNHTIVIKDPAFPTATTTIVVTPGP